MKHCKTEWQKEINFYSISTSVGSTKQIRLGQTNGGFYPSPLTLGKFQLLPKFTRRKNKWSSLTHVTNLQTNCCLNELSCYLGSVLICIDNGILPFRKKDLFYCVIWYTFRVLTCLKFLNRTYCFSPDSFTNNPGLSPLLLLKGLQI